MGAFSEAQVKIIQLSRSGEFALQRVKGGGPIPPEMQEKNREILARYEKARLDIIKEYGAIKDYAEPIFKRIYDLEKTLIHQKKELALLQSICEHPNVKENETCPICFAPVKREPK